MKPVSFSTPSAAPGRPREVTLTDDQAARYRELVLLANKDRNSGSASMAWRVLCQEFPEIGWNPNQRSSKHQLPAVAIELARQANGLIGLHRQGERGLRAGAAYTPGGLRVSDLGDRRLYGGERASWDDATVNFGVVIPWPYGGCKLSDRYGVKLGRFQLLLCHDEATSYVPAWSHVIRDSQAYRGEDVAAAVMRVSRDVCLFDKLVLEGGVWQGRRMKRVMEGMGVGLIDAKGRPQCKLVENYFNRLWTRLAMERGLSSVGRFRGEEKATSELYVKCRAGNADPRGRFPWLHEAVDGVETAVRFLNADRIESSVYGKWVPEERWSHDMEAHPRPVLAAEKLWLAEPVMEKRVVTRNGVSVTATGPMGLKMRYQFTGACLWDMEGREVEIYFDPLAEWPLRGTIAKPGTAVALGTVDCANPYHEGGIGAEAAKNVREVMRREYRVIWNAGRQLDVAHRESSVRGLHGIAETNTFHRSGTDQPAGREKNQGVRDATAVPEPRHPTVAVETHLDAGGAREGSLGERRTTAAGVDPFSASGRPGITHDRVSGGERIMPAPGGGSSAEALRSVRRRAAEARDLTPNW